MHINLRVQCLIFNSQARKKRKIFTAIIYQDFPYLELHTNPPTMKFLVNKCYLLICLFLVFPLSLFTQEIGEITWTESFLSPEHSVPTNRLNFGYITVPENYDKPEGKTLQIAFIIIKAYKNESNTDASMYFTGGWGARTLKNLNYYQRHFLSSRRDLILYDYRGVGYSEPKLCEDMGAAVFKNVLSNISYSTFEERQKQIFDKCLDQLEQAGIDKNQYGSNNKARDGVLLAEALNYESYNLFGVSYGTKSILQFIRQSTVKIRSVILDSNCPLDFPINSGMTEDYAKSLEHIIEDCEKDPQCSKKYTDLKPKLETFLHSLDEKPLKIRLPQNRVAYLNKQEVNGIIHQMLYDENAFGSIPFVLKKFSNRNKFIIKRILRNLEEVLVENYNGHGLINYVYDHKPFQEKAGEIALQAKQQFPAYQVFDGHQAYYLQDTHFESNVEQTETLVTDIPTLILAGAYDPVTPAYYSQMLRPYFSNHFYVEFPRTGHGVTDNFCGKSMAGNFLNNFQNPLENACLNRIERETIWFNR